MSKFLTLNEIQVFLANNTLFSLEDLLESLEKINKLKGREIKIFIELLNNYSENWDHENYYWLDAIDMTRNKSFQEIIKNVSKEECANIIDLLVTHGNVNDWPEDLLKNFITISLGIKKEDREFYYNVSNKIVEQASYEQGDELEVFIEIYEAVSQQNKKRLEQYMALNINKQFYGYGSFELASIIKRLDYIDIDLDYFVNLINGTLVHHHQNELDDDLMEEDGIYDPHVRDFITLYDALYAFKLK
ncbi:MAG: hypothetical protein Q8L85_01390 [Alphaproteobacteria bacterium]|nr:hypothetical protein [Alphaproteobacteria bacterium]